MTNKITVTVEYKTKQFERYGGGFSIKIEYPDNTKHPYRTAKFSGIQTIKGIETLLSGKIIGNENSNRTHRPISLVIPKRKHLPKKETDKLEDIIGRYNASLKLLNAPKSGEKS
ncbi:MAG: hypothetical protein AABX66_03110 [Nanoarchaeota archaeon]